MTDRRARDERLSAAAPGKRVPTASLAGSSFKFVLGAARRELLTAIAWEAVAVVSLVGTLLFGREIVAALSAETAATWTDLLPETLGLAVSLLLAGMARAVIREYRVLVTALTTARTQEDIIDVATSVPFEEFETQQFNDLLQRANSQVTQSAQQMVFDLLSLANVFMTSVALVAVLATTVPAVLPALLVVAVPFVVAARASANLAFSAAHQLTPDDRLRAYLYRALTGRREAKEIRVFQLAPQLQRRWRRLFDDRMSTMRQVARRRMLFSASAAAAAAVMIGILLLVLVRAAVRGDISLADAAVAIVALQQLSTRVRSASGTTGSLRRSALFLDEFDSFRALAPTVDSSPCDEGSDPPSAGRLVVDQVNFVYPNTDVEVLTDISFALEPGAIVAIVGASGSGKTTLAHLIAGLYRPTAGSITYASQDISDIPRADYWRLVAPVFQDFVRYELTATENISLGDIDSPADDQRTVAAAESAGIADAIRELRSGFETMLSRAYEDGGDLSVGQWQRIAVARAFYRNAQLLVFDEPASALDPVAERDLYLRLADLIAGRSAVLVSHRFSTARLADLILVMRDGRVIERGTHTELMGQDGAYAEMFRLQAEGLKG